MFPPKSFFFPEYHRSISFPLRLRVFSWHRSESTILPSRITYGEPSARARSSASRSPGARSASTSVTTPARIPPTGNSPGYGSFSWSYRTTAGGEQAGNEQDQVPRHVEHDTIRGHAEPSGQGG